MWNVLISDDGHSEKKSDLLRQYITSLLVFICESG